MPETLPVFSLHGWALNAAVFDVSGLRLNDRQLVAIDLPGHGRRREEPLGTDTDAIVARLLKVAPPRAIWMGWSLGGMLAMAAALAAPERIAGLMVIAAGASFIERADWPDGVPRRRLQRMGRDLLENPQRTVNDFLTLQVLSSTGARPALRSLKAALAERGAASLSALEDGLALLEQIDLTNSVGRIDVPMLVCGGGRDRLVHPAAVRALGSRIPGAETLVIDEAGHVPFLTHPAEFGEAVERFLKSARL